MELEQLLDEDAITKARKEGEKLVEGLTTEQYKEIRRLCKTDLFYLCWAVLKFKRLSPNLHGNLCEWINNTRESQFREILLPRSHFKSTVATIGHSIQIVLPDDSGSLPWPLNLGTNCRLLIAHETSETASRFLFAITSHFISNPLLMALFPECVPNIRKHKINKQELELPRTERWPEPTIDTMGVGGKSQGRHYNYLKLDDLFGDKARDSNAERETTLNWFDNIQSFFSFHAKDKFDLIGTRWSLDDLYAHAHKMYYHETTKKDLIVKYIRPIEEYKKDEKTGVVSKQIIFPEEFNEQKLSILKKNRKVWTAQYLNDPREGGNEFDPSWKRFFEWVDRRTIRYKESQYSEEWTYRTLDQLDKVILVDPAVNGNYGYIVTGMDQRKNKFVLSAIERSWRPPEFMDHLFRDVIRWQPRVVGIENVLFSSLYQIWCIREMAIRGLTFKVEPLTTKQKEKKLRVLALSNFFSGGEIYFHESQTQLIEEFDYFGSIEEYHMLDALAHGPQIWRCPSPSWMAEEISSDSKEDDRDIVTGYSL